MAFEEILAGVRVAYSTAEMLYGALGKLVGIGSSRPCAIAKARLYIWLLVAPAAAKALATTSQLRISVVIAGEKDRLETMARGSC